MHYVVRILTGILCTWLLVSLVWLFFPFFFFFFCFPFFPPFTFSLLFSFFFFVYFSFFFCLFFFVLFFFFLCSFCLYMGVCKLYENSMPDTTNNFVCPQVYMQESSTFWSKNRLAYLLYKFVARIVTWLKSKVHKLNLV